MLILDFIKILQPRDGRSVSSLMPTQINCSGYLGWEGFSGQKAMINLCYLSQVKEVVRKRGYLSAVT